MDVPIDGSPAAKLLLASMHLLTGAGYIAALEVAHRRERGRRTVTRPPSNTARSRSPLEGQPAKVSPMTPASRRPAISASGRPRMSRKHLVVVLAEGRRRSSVDRPLLAWKPERERDVHRLAADRVAHGLEEPPGRPAARSPVAPTGARPAPPARPPATAGRPPRPPAARRTTPPGRRRSRRGGPGAPPSWPARAGPPTPGRRGPTAAPPTGRRRPRRWPPSGDGRRRRRRHRSR